MRDRERDNAHRLSGVLERYAEDNNAVAVLAKVLNYHPGQLQKDMGSLAQYVSRLEAQQQ